MMRLLFFTPRKCWPANSGARLRDYNLARQLARDCAVTYLTVCYPEEESFAHNDSGLDPPEKIFGRVITVPEATTYGALNLIRGLTGPTPVTVLNWTSRRAAEQVARLGREMNFDAIHLVGVHLAEYLPVLRGFPGRPAVVCDWHDIQSEKMRRYSETAMSLPRRLYARRTARLLENRERALLNECALHTVVSGRDREILRKIAPKAKFEVVENGVDAPYFEAVRRRPSNNILFVGAMDYNANEDAVAWFAEKVWPRVRQRSPELRFVIAGRKPGARVLALSQEPGIEVAGTVPDVRPYYETALAVVAPLLWGSGTRLKIVEAMAAGAPVISTTLGAEGLEYRRGEDLLIADSPEAMADAILAIQGNPLLVDRLTEAGRALVRSRYDWSIPGQRLLSMYKNGLRELNS